jgi:glycolate oxidase
MIAESEIKALREIVGHRWVSADACMMDTYSFYMNPETLVKDGGRWTPRPVAVVMPETTAEVSEIMRLCNETGLMAKPISTGFHCVAAASRDRVVVLDLKRMNKIIDIDVKNQTAIIEPYVKAIDLQTELFKHGLNVHVISCGGNHSVLASTAAAWGYGVGGSSTSFSGRNLLGLEWVLPTGEVLTLGSGGARAGGAEAGWFTADGPGPSMRGIVRGFQGTFGALGVFTKCAVKLYKWDGPAKWEVQGKSPLYSLKEMPPRMAMNALAFPSAQAMKDAGYKLGEAEIDHAQFRTPMFFSALGMTENNEELKIALESGVFQKTMDYALVNAVVGHSDGEFKWKMKALKQILKETGGVIVPMNFKVTAKALRRMQRFIKHIDDPLAPLRRLPVLQDILGKIPIGKKQRLVQQSLLFWLLIRNAINTQSTFRPSQGLGTAMGSFDTWDLGVTQSDWFAEQKRAYIEKGLILDDGGDCGCGGTFENGHLGYLEGIFMYDAKRPESVMASGELVGSGAQGSIDNALGVPIAAFGIEMNNLFGPECGNYHHWIAKIKQALDPNTASDPFFYGEPPSEENEASPRARTEDGAGQGHETAS